MTAAARVERYSHADDSTKMSLVLADLDDHDRQFDAISRRLNAILWALVMAAVSTTTASILLAISIAAK